MENKINELDVTMKSVQRDIGELIKSLEELGQREISAYINGWTVTLVKEKDVLPDLQ